MTFPIQYDIVEWIGLPQLVKGGKYAYAWSKVGPNGRIVVPNEAITEYGFETVKKLIAMSASKRSGGFALTTPLLLKNSQLSVILDREPRLAEFQLPEGETVTIDARHYCWVKLNNGEFAVPLETLKKYGVKVGDQLLSVRGSRLALAFIVKGPIIEEAKKHPNLAAIK
jgi:bifunctional DNA-binding transcriptional regulator/antitoxin component of YhaV-PrlF toxin-antitoxin module